MSKILVIEDEERFRVKLNLATLRSRCVVADVMDLLKDYEEDVIGFEAEVAYAYKGFLIDRVTSNKPLNELAKDVKPGDPLQILVLKPKKPEMKGEKEKT